jgi:phage terminase large subunit GpA-like protein
VLWTELERKAAVSSCRACPQGCTIGEGGEIIGEYEDAPHKALTVPAVLVDPMFTTVDTLAADYADAQRHVKAGNINPYRNFRNNQEGKPWEEKERQTSLAQLRRHIGTCAVRTVPEWAQMICLGIDVHPDHVWAAVKAYGYRNQQALIWAGRIETGHTGRADNWDIVEKLILSEWVSAANESVKFRVVKTGVDCRYQMSERGEEATAVYDFCLRFTEGYVLPIMGYGRKRMRYAGYRTANVAGKSLKRFDVNVDAGKDKLWQALYDKARRPGPGYMHLWSGVGDDILRQLASEEQIVKRIGGGREIVVWQPKKGFRDNHIWDCCVYADFAADLAGVWAITDPGEKIKEIPVIGKPIGKKPIQTKY